MHRAPSRLPVHEVGLVGGVSLADSPITAPPDEASGKAPRVFPAPPSVTDTRATTGQKKEQYDDDVIASHHYSYCETISSLMDVVTTIDIR